MVVVADVLAEFTDTPSSSWFAIWEGHGYDDVARDALRALPRFDRPTRRYVLLGGAVSDVGSIRWPGEDRWFRPDLWWPDDHRWFVGSDVDFWSNYVGGSRAMTDALAARLPDRCAPVTLDDRLRLEE
jgi:hypothetical protein